MQYETIIGLEVHAQMNTKTKMFCACDNDAFGKSPNTTVCPICMGHPGTLPVPNGESLTKAMRTATALKCTVNAQSHLDRKNYFYPDLPMGYQISQYDFPISSKGEVSFGDGKVCGITRLHIENDAGKLMHAGGRSYCDYNRAGTPLMEIVTEPDLRSSDDAMEFAKELQRILLSVDTSEADMYKGMMRFDASISLRPVGDEKLYPRSEIKNLNSFRSLGKALEFEKKRLLVLWEKGEPQSGEVTVHWDDDREVGEIMREKESAADYRYFPEPDIPPLSFDKSVLAELKNSVGELPEESRARYSAIGLSEDQVTLLVSQPKLARYFDAVANASDTKRAASVVMSQLLGFLKSQEKEISDAPSSDHVIDLLRCVDEGVINNNAAKSVLEKMVETGDEPRSIIKKEDMGSIGDTDELRAILEKIVAENSGIIVDIKNGKEKAKAAIVGLVMKETRGQADPQVVQDLLSELLAA